MNLNGIMPLAGFFPACFAVANSGAFFRPGDWYENLAKPPWDPPNRLFGRAWTVFCSLVAVSGWLVWGQAGFGIPLLAYGVHPLSNAAWSAIFFGLRRPSPALVELAVSWVLILATIPVFAPVSSAAAWLLAPYLAWMTFAGVLNHSIWQRNRAIA